MAASTVSLKPQFSNSTDFRTFIAMIRTHLAAAGLVQTSDTGQLDPATVNLPGGAYTMAGYEIWRSNDGGSGLNNFYIKFEYGVYAATTNIAMYFTVGWGSDGAGNITGNQTARASVYLNTNSGTAYDCNFGGATDGSWFTMALYATNSVSAFLSFSVERVRDKTGAELDIVFVYSRSNGNINGINHTIPRVGSVPTQEPGGGHIAPNSSSGLYGGNFGFGLIFPQMGAYLMPSLNNLLGDSTNFNTAQMTYVVDAYGSPHTYIACASSSSGGSGRYLLMRYE